MLTSKQISDQIKEEATYNIMNQLQDNLDNTCIQKEYEIYTNQIENIEYQKRIYRIQG